MGARLTIKYHSGDRDIASTYHHWAGNTESAMETLEEIGTSFISGKQLVNKMESLGMKPYEHPDGNRNDGLYEYGDEQKINDLYNAGEMSASVDLSNGTIYACDLFA